MTKPKPTITPTREFNAAILDRIVAHAMPEDQRGDEFTTTDLVARGMTYSTAKTYCEVGFTKGDLARRWGISRNTRRRTWIYREKEATK